MNYDLTSSYDYDLPEELVADIPAPVRSASRLMVGDVGARTVSHHAFADLTDLLSPGDLLVFNDIRVVSARLNGHKSTGGAVELFVIDVCSPHGPDRWTTPTDELELSCMTRSSKPLRKDQEVYIGDHVFRVRSADAGIAVVRTAAGGRSADELLRLIGDIPLPPYIVRRRDEMGTPRAQDVDAERYQTVYANRPGAVAAPTAGLHFDDAMLQRLADRGISTATVTLEVGPGTFRPVMSETLSDHPMHSERYTIRPDLSTAIATARAGGGRIVAVGTTTVRTLESEALRDTPFEPGERSTSLFIKPGFEFRAIDAMVTNFHLPRSTLLALVFGFGTPELVREMYATAVAERYRFYSYGDAMFLWNRP